MLLHDIPHEVQLIPASMKEAALGLFRRFNGSYRYFAYINDGFHEETIWYWNDAGARWDSAGPITTWTVHAHRGAMPEGNYEVITVPSLSSLVTMPDPTR